MPTGNFGDVFAGYVAAQMGLPIERLIVATNINDLAECAVTACMMDRRELEPVRINENPVDVLAQSLVGLAVFASVTPDEAFALVRRTFPFRALTRETFDRVLRYLDGGGVSLERAYRDTFGKVIINAEGHLAYPRTRTTRDYFQNIGTISAAGISANSKNRFSSA